MLCFYLNIQHTPSVEHWLQFHMTGFYMLCLYRDAETDLFSYFQYCRCMEKWQYLWKYGKVFVLHFRIQWQIVAWICVYNQSLMFLVWHFCGCSFEDLFSRSARRKPFLSFKRISVKSLKMLGWIFFIVHSQIRFRVGVWKLSRLKKVETWRAACCCK